MAQDEASVNEDGSKAWIDNGILYNEYASHLDVSIALETAKRSVELMKEEKLSKAPVIADFTRVAEAHFSMKLTDYAKIIRSFDLLRHLTSIWIVGASPKVREQLTIASRAFFEGQMHFADSVDQAKQALGAMSPDKQELILP